MKKSIKRGFTMIELLIVIAVLAVLAIATISAINPIEQINRSRDTGSRSDAETLIGAIDRYYTSRNYFPWMVSETSGSVPQAWVLATAVTDGTTLLFDKLAGGAAGAAELKEAFKTRVTANNNLYVYNRGTAGDSTYVCFLPKSSSFEQDALTRCGGTLPGDFPAAACGGTLTTDYTCLP